LAHVLVNGVLLDGTTVLFHFGTILGVNPVTRLDEIDGVKFKNML